MTRRQDAASSLRRGFGWLGPAIVVACVVMGPGSILTSSKVGCQFGYQMTWVVIAAGTLMIGAVATAGQVGVCLQQSPCQALADRLGRPAAVLVGATVFLITACFQFSNNLGVLAAIEPLAEMPSALRVLLLVLLNAAAAGCLFGLRRIYSPMEKLMMLLVGIMLLGFAANLVMAKPQLPQLLAGAIPNIPAELAGSFWPRLEKLDPSSRPQLIDPWIAVQGLIATTFSIAGAFYQAYLAKEKGWTRDQLQRGVVDSVVGTTTLACLTLMIMATSAAVLGGRVAPEELQSAADVARQLEPLFGPAAKWLFCLGVFAGALSSFLVNSMIGGTMLADGLGLDAKLDSVWTKRFTILVMAIGMLVALGTSSEGRVPLIILAHALTVLGGPILALSLLYLATRRIDGERRLAPAWMIALVAVGGAVVLALAVRTAVRIWLTLTAAGAT